MTYNILNAPPAARHIGRLLSGACLIGLAAGLAALPSTAAAQNAFRGPPPTVNSGIVTIVQGGVDGGTGQPLDTIIIDSPTAVIQWEPDPLSPGNPTVAGNIEFLSAGTIGRFQSGSIPTDFTVLNLVLPTGNSGTPLDRVIELNGTIESRINGIPGGNVWFYTPGGFLVGGTAVIDVGGLVLSTSQIDDTQLFTGLNGTINFTGAPTPTSRITIDSGASILASNYVAMVAPRIEQGSTVTVDGSIAYVAAEQTMITMNGGLFDIVVTDGSDDANGVVHTGTTTGPESLSSADVQRIHMVAVPKNQAMTMLLSGTIGYTAAASAANEGSAVILSAGSDVQNSPPDIFFSPSIDGATGLPNSGSANITVSGNTDFSNATTAYALDAITLDAGAGEQINAASDLILYAQREGAGGLIAFTAAGSGSIDVTGTLIADAHAGANSITGTPGMDTTGGTITLTTTGGTIAFGDASMFDVHAFGGDGTTGGTGTGGSIAFLADGGSITGTGETTLFANGYSGSSEMGSGLAAGDGVGGTITLATGAGGGDLSFGTLIATADGNDIFFNDPSEPFINFDGDGGDGIGGAITVTMDGGSLTAGDVTLSASGFGYAAGAHDSALGTTPFVSGSGTGGLVGFSASGGTATLTTLTMNADGEGGLSLAGDSFAPIGSTAGNGTGGTASLALSGTGALALTDLTLSAFGTGGLGGDAFDSFSSPPPVSTFLAEDGGDGTGGNAFIALANGSLTATTVNIGANGEGGVGGNNETLGSGGMGGAGSGGSADFGSSGGTHDIGTLSIEARGAGGAGGAGRYISGFDPVTFDPIYAYDAAPGGAGGAGAGGTAGLTGGNGTTVTTLTVDASGVGGAGGDGLVGGNGGDVTIGLARADFLAGTPFAFGSWLMQARSGGGAGGASPSGGTAGTAGIPTPSSVGGIAVTLADGSTTNGTSATWVSDSGIAMDADGAGTIALTGAFAATAAGTIGFSHNNRPANANTLGADSIVLTAGGPITSTGDTRLRATGSFSAQSLMGGISMTDIGSGTDTVLLAANGAVAVTTDLVAGGTVSADGQSISITSLGDIAFDHAIATAGDFTLDAGGTASFVNASSAAQNIVITSADIDIGTGASLTAVGQVQLASDGSSAFDYIGGADNTAGYSLSGAEIARLFGTDIIIAPQSQSIIGDFTVVGGTGGNIDANGLFVIDSAGRMRVEGDLQLTGLGTAGGLTLRAGNGIDVIADTASIDLRGAGNVLGGILSMESASVTVATQSAIDDITGTGITIEERDTRLAQNDGIVSDDGYLRAGQIAIDVIEGVYIQNSGAGTDFDQRRGFTANSVSINTGQGGAGEIVINGRLVDPQTGGFITGLTALQQVDVNGGSGGYATGSTINGCLIASPTICTVTPPPQNEPEIDIPTRNEDIERALDPETGLAGDALPTVIIELKEFEQTGFPPLIDEPVTGAGNDDLWTSTDCADGTGAGCAGTP
tara:strand:- start:46835 stop:51250 length:4416 start_codon:yes stop_codon:yes gene_type:complete